MNHASFGPVYSGHEPPKNLGWSAYEGTEPIAEDALERSLGS